MIRYLIVVRCFWVLLTALFPCLITMAIFSFAIHLRENSRNFCLVTIFQRNWIMSLTRSRGFGFDEKSNNYKFLIIIQRKDLYPKVHIYSLATDRWRNIDYPMLSNTALFINSPQGYFNGACHWYVRRFCDEQDKPKCPMSIMSFRMDTEVFEEMPIPGHVISARDTNIQTIYASSKEPKNLVLILRNPQRIYEVWVMREYGVKESWSQQYTFGPIEVYMSLRPIPMGSDNEVLVYGTVGEPALYNFDTKTTRALKTCNKDSIRCSFYMESLVSIKRISGVV